jgi:hypothetical protein
LLDVLRGGLNGDSEHKEDVEVGLQILWLDYKTRDDVEGFQKLLLEDSLRFAVKKLLAMPNRCSNCGKDRDSYVTGLYIF